MLPVRFGIGSIGISTFGIFAAFSFVVASFLLWRKLREDYLDEEIITFTILITLFALLGGRILFLLDHFGEFGLDPLKWFLFPRFPGFSPVGAFLSAVIFASCWVKRKNWNFWVLADSVVPVAMVVFFICSLGFALLSQPSLSPVVIFVWAKPFLAILALFLSILLARHFRKFIWYRSGKPGFIACGTLAVYFLGLFALDFWGGYRLYLELVGAAGVAIFALIFLYQRSERSIKEDLTALTESLGGKFIKR